MKKDTSKSRKDEELNIRVTEAWDNMLKEDPDPKFWDTDEEYESEVFRLLEPKILQWINSFVNVQAAKNVSFKKFLNYCGSKDNAVQVLMEDILIGVTTDKGTIKVRPVFDKLKQYDRSKNDSILGYFNSVVRHACQNALDYHLDILGNTTRTYRRNSAKLAADPDALSERQKKNLSEHNKKTVSIDHSVPGSDSDRTLQDMISSDPYTDRYDPEEEQTSVLIDYLFPRDDEIPHSRQHTEKIKKRDGRKREYLRQRCEENPDTINELQDSIIQIQNEIDARLSKFH